MPSRVAVVSRRMMLEHYPGGVLLGCRDCPPYRRALTTAGGVTVEWVRHLTDCHDAMHEAASFASVRRKRGMA